LTVGMDNAAFDCGGGKRRVWFDSRVIFGVQIN
jgi:hypothetical protein